MRIRLLCAITCVLAACQVTPADPNAASAPPEIPEAALAGPIEDLPLGDVEGLDDKADGPWGAALKCKPIPKLAPLKAPQIVISLDGLTLHLVDKITGFDKVYPIGPGMIEKGASMTPVSTNKAAKVFYLRGDQAAAMENSNKTYAPWGWSYSCKIWWQEPGTGKKSPVFAGLPFIRLDGAPTLGYALHGPIDGFTAPSGGALRRGYVSHGCVRMEAQDIVQVFALTRGSKVPVRVQQAVERLPGGVAVDLPQKWLLSECKTDADCNFPGGRCESNDWSATGWCTASCSGPCPLDKYGYPTSFCVANPLDASKGACTLKSTLFNNDCRRYPGFEELTGAPRFKQPWVKSDVCLPGSPGWIGSACQSDLDCALSKGKCDFATAKGGGPGLCTTACTSSCASLPGFAKTGCLAGKCREICTSADDCEAGHACVATSKTAPTTCQ